MRAHQARARRCIRIGFRTRPLRRAGARGPLLPVVVHVEEKKLVAA